MITGGPTALEVHSALAPLEAEWTGLARAGRNVFGTYEWLSTWWRHFGRERPLLVGVTRAVDGRAEVLLPLYRSTTRPVPVLRFLGHGVSDQLGPLGGTHRPGGAAAALGALLGREQGAWRLLVADDLPAGEPWAEGAGGRVVARQASPVVSLAGTTWADWLAARSGNFRATLRRSRRALERRGRVTIRYTDDPDRLDADAAVLFDLHRRRWAAAGGSRAFWRREAFHLDAMRVALTRDWLRLWFLELDGVAVAALYNLRFEGIESFYQSGRDPALTDCSPGLVLHAHAIRTAFDEGVDEYRLLRGTEAYKGRLADRDPGLVTLLVHQGLAGAAASAVVRRGPRLPTALRRRVPASLAWGGGGAPLWGPP